MKKVELTLPELAAVSAMVEREVQYAAKIRTAAKAALRDDPVGPGYEPEDDFANVEYWTERLHMLRQLKAKLEREE